jgi:hypothetical protein
VLIAGFARGERAALSGGAVAPARTVLPVAIIVVIPIAPAITILAIAVVVVVPVVMAAVPLDIVTYVVAVGLDVSLQRLDLTIRSVDAVPVVTSDLPVTLALQVVQTLLVATNVVDIAPDVLAFTIVAIVVVIGERGNEADKADEKGR